jgi:hypothetical protein
MLSTECVYPPILGSFTHIDTELCSWIAIFLCMEKASTSPDIETCVKAILQHGHLLLLLVLGFLELVNRIEVDSEVRIQLSA